MQRATGSHRPEAAPTPASHGVNAQLPPATRLEFFSDAVFAFAATLLVVALEVPHTFPELEKNLWGFLAFGFSFLALALIWSSHHAYFRRFPVADRATVALNFMLLFVVLFYVYPLKFMTVSLFDVVLGLHPERRGEMFRGEGDVIAMFVVYGIGFVAVFGVFSLLYRHAARIAPALGLTPLQVHEARAMQRQFLILAGVGRAVDRHRRRRHRRALRRAGVRLRADRAASVVARRLERAASAGRLACRGVTPPGAAVRAQRLR